MKNWKKSLAVGAAVAILTTGLGAAPALAKVTFDTFDLEAHRGGRDVRPENTLYAFAYAMELGVTTLEMDMQMTKDGKIVISHNPKMSWILAKGPDGKYAPKQNPPDIRTMTLEEVKKWDVGTMNPAAGDYYDSHGKPQLACPGAKLPTLDEVFELANAYGNDKIIFNIETKSYADPKDEGYVNNPNPATFSKAVYEVIKKYNMQDRVTLQTFDWRTLTEFRKLDSRITLVALTCEQPSWGLGGLYRRVNEAAPSPWMGGLNINDFKGDDYISAAKKAGADIVSPYYMELSPDKVAQAHELGMKVVPWTVNSVKDMNMLLDMGVDGLISDKPHIARELLIQRGIAVAEPAKAPSGMVYSTGTGTVNEQSKELSKGGDAAH